MSKLIVILLALWGTSLLGSSSGFYWTQHFFFPAGSLPEANWDAHMIVYVESPRRVIDFDEKPFKITIRNRKGEKLYFESGKLSVSVVRASIEWKTVSSLKLVLKDEAGKLLLERSLELDPLKNLFIVKE